jgi:hypothetical protein
MADFMNWTAYYRLRNELESLKAELKKVEGWKSPQKFFFEKVEKTLDI